MNPIDMTCSTRSLHAKDIKVQAALCSNFFKCLSGINTFSGSTMIVDFFHHSMEESLLDYLLLSEEDPMLSMSVFVNTINDALSKVDAKNSAT